jgi:hypothetical protein
MAGKRESPSGLSIKELEVTVQGTAPLVILPLGCFKDRTIDEDQDEVEQSLKLYRRADGDAGFPAGGIKQAVLEAVRSLDTDTKRNVAAGMHIVGEPETNMVRLEGKPRGEDFDFDFKRPKRVVTITLPVYDKWSCRFNVQYLGSSISRKDIETFFAEAGRRVGLGHRRPERGTFEVKKVVAAA